MLALLIFAGMVSMLVYYATYKFQRRRRIIVAAVVFALFGILPAGFATLFDDLVSCWLYYEQCKATRIPGLSEQDCLKREGAIGYLIDQGICLVKRQ